MLMMKKLKVQKPEGLMVQEFIRLFSNEEFI